MFIKYSITGAWKFETHKDETFMRLKNNHKIKESSQTSYWAQYLDNIHDTFHLLVSKKSPIIDVKDRNHF